MKPKTPMVPGRLLACALLVLCSAASYAAAPAKWSIQTLGTLGVSLKVTGGATRTSDGIGFPVTGGQVDNKTFSGSANLEARAEGHEY